MHVDSVNISVDDNYIMLNTFADLTGNEHIACAPGIVHCRREDVKVTGHLRGVACADCEYQVHVYEPIRNII